MEYNKLTNASFTSDGTAEVFRLAYLPRRVFLLNKTAFSSTANPGIVKRAYAFSTDTNGSTYFVRNSNGLNTDVSGVLTVAGIQFVTRDTYQFGPVKTGTVVSQAASARVTITSHGYVTGDTVWIYLTTGMLQIAGAPYRVTFVDANNFDIPVNSSGFAAAATAVKAKKLLYPDLYIPFGCVITNITAAASAVVTTSVAHQFVVGQKVRFQVPLVPGAASGAWGMVEMNDLEANVTAVSTTTITVDVDSSAFTAFVYPTSAEASVGHEFAMVYPIGDTNFGFTGPTVPFPIGIPGAFVANTGYQVIVGIGGNGSDPVMHADGDEVELEFEYPDQLLDS